MHVYDLRDRQTGRASRSSRQTREPLDDGARGPYGVACTHEARAVVEVRLGARHTLLSCAECGAILGVTPAPAA